ncbi:hypothetical protein EBZ38_03260 [bacterium]|nr:hypothetical protein [bacterium]NDC93980.1 hypothetical protein [bacterium]NDD83285.1 hypothetical protein [bacterium]
MPSFTGFTYQEIKNHVIAYIGNSSSEFATFLDSLLVMAEHRYFKMHDWSFTYKTNLALLTNPDLSEYELKASTIGYFMASTDVESIRSDEDNVYLIKLDLQQLRRMSMNTNDEMENVPPLYWAVAGDNRIAFWPSKSKSTLLKIDGKITPAIDLSGSPAIPMRYQEAFIEYVKALALDRENDDRAQGKKIEALNLIRQDIQDDMRSLGDSENPRIKSIFEIYDMQARMHPNSSAAGGSAMIVETSHNLTGTVTVKTSDYYLGCNTLTAPVTLNIPSAADAGPGKKYIIKDEKGNASVNNITVVASGNTIDGSATYVLKVNYEAITLVCDGTNWFIA